LVVFGKSNDEKRQFHAVAALFAVPPAYTQNAFTPDQVKFGPAPSFLPPGALLAVLEGDPMASTGDFTIRLKMPDGYKIAPHTHPTRENVIVLSGTPSPVQFNYINPADDPSGKK
jgi:hypothetical protein